MDRDIELLDPAVAPRPRRPLNVCSGCGRNFRDVESFDAHRSRDFQCVDPVVVGLVLTDGAWQ